MVGQNVELRAGQALEALFQLCLFFRPKAALHVARHDLAHGLRSKAVLSLPGSPQGVDRVGGYHVQVGQILGDDVLGIVARICGEGDTVDGAG